MQVAFRITLHGRPEKLPEFRHTGALHRHVDCSAQRLHVTGNGDRMLGPWRSFVRPLPGDVVLQPLVHQGRAYALSSPAGVFQFRFAAYPEALAHAERYAHENGVDVLHTEDGEAFSLIARYRRD